MTEILNTDICIIGAGSGGLSVAAGAVQMGADVVLLERADMGGDFLTQVVSRPKPCWPQAVKAAGGAPAMGTAGAERLFAAVKAHVVDVIAASPRMTC